MERTPIAPSSSATSRSGQALLVVTFSLSLIFGMLSLAVDLGWAYYRREAAQTAAEAAAGAVVRAVLATSPAGFTCGANQVWCGSPAGTITNCPATAPSTASTSFDNGCMLAAANGFTTAGTTKTVSIQANTTSSVPTAPGASVSYWVTVRVVEKQTGVFGAPLNSALLTSAARVSVGVTTAASSGISSSCIYILSHNNGTDAFSIGNAAHVTTSSCGIYVNSSAAEAMLVTGGATVTSASIQTVGGVTKNNGGTTSSTPHTGVAPIADPFLSLPALTPAGTCNSGNFTNWQATPYTPAAGTYCGFNVGNGMSTVMGAGTYIINGGTFSVQGGSTLTASGAVLVYLTNGATVSIANGASVTLSPQTSGTYQGVLFFQDRSMTTPAASSFAGGASMHLSGSLYFPYALLNIDNGNNSQTEAVVANSVNFQGGAQFNQATTGSQTGLGSGGGYVESVVE